MVGWEQRRPGEAASLLQDRKFVKVKGPGKSRRVISILRLGLIRACIYNWSWNPAALGSAVPLVESLKSKTTPCAMRGYGKNLTHLQSVLLFKDSPMSGLEKPQHKRQTAC
jgi:hypothetical protein